MDRLHRHAERGTDELTALHRLLDSQLAGTLATVSEGMPWAVPMLFARDGNHILLHGSTGAGALRHVAAGSPVAFTVTAVDAIVVAATTFSSSANYRSAVVRGVPIPLTGTDKTDALNRFSEKLLPGRTSEVRPMTGKEQAATLAMRLPIEPGQWLMKARTGGPATNAEAEADSDVWAGVIPLNLSYDNPEPAQWSRDLPVPPSVRALTDHD